jgi:hypothetical protein
VSLLYENVAALGGGNNNGRRSTDGRRRMANNHSTGKADLTCPSCRFESCPKAVASLKRRIMDGRVILIIWAVAILFIIVYGLTHLPIK